MLFHFLSYRASGIVFAKAVQQFPDLLRRSCWRTDLAGNDPQIAAYARAHHLGVLPDDLRSEAADVLESAVLTNLDASFFDESEMLALLTPLRLVGMGLALRTTVLPSLEERIDEIVADADLDEEPDNHFKKLLAVLDRIETIGVDADATALIDDARNQVKRSVKGLEQRKREQEEGSKDEADWTHIVTQKKEETPAPTPVATKRSVFDDVDK
jgi:hypothetical protein